MPYSVYVFKRRQEGISQYPDDYAHAIFENFCKFADNKSQIITHRKANVMYYGYICKITKTDWMGFCVLLNSVYFDSIEPLANIFEKTVNNIIDAGEIFKYDLTGKICSSPKPLTGSLQECERVCRFIQDNLDTKQIRRKILPAESLAINPEKQISIDIEEPIKDIIASTWKYGYVSIPILNDITNSSSAQNIIRKLNAKCDNLNVENNRLKKENIELKRKKKPFVLIGLLVIAIIAFVFALFKEHEDHISALSHKDIEINGLQEETIETNNSIAQREKQLSIEKRLKDSVQVLFNQLHEAMPILIKDVTIANVYENGTIETDYGNTLYSYRSMNFKPRLNYIGYSDQKLTLNVRLFYVGDNKDYYKVGNYYDNIEVRKGENDVNITGCGGPEPGRWSSGQYRFEFWYSGRCLFARSFTVY